jgi:uncharacterized protein YciI
MLGEGATPEEEAKIGEHFLYLKGLVEAGCVLLAGRTTNTDESSFGIVIFTAASEEEAGGIMRGDPAVRAGVFAAELFPYRVALASPRLASQP